jgi:hypothetical protein
MAYWSTAQCANGGTAAVEMVSGHNFAGIKSSAGAGGLGSLSLGTDDMTNAIDLPILSFTIKVDTILGAEVGFFRYADTPFTADQNGAYFRFSASKIYAVTGDGADEEVVDVTPVGYAINKYYQLRIEFGSAWVKFYVDDMTTDASTNTTHLTTDDLTIKASTAVSGGVSQIIHIDGIGLVRLRKK